jgi:hypothetical protein
VRWSKIGLPIGSPYVINREATLASFVFVLLEPCYNGVGQNLDLRRWIAEFLGAIFVIDLVGGHCSTDISDRTLEHHESWRDQGVAREPKSGCRRPVPVVSRRLPVTPRRTVRHLRGKKPPRADDH